MILKVIDSECKVLGTLELTNNRGGRVLLERGMCKVGGATFLEKLDPRSLGYSVKFKLLNGMKDLDSGS